MTGKISRPSERQVCLALVLSLLLLQASFAQEQRISCFLIGSVHPNRCPFTNFFSEDPLFTYSVEPIPADLPDEAKRKIDRLYFPRTRRSLVESFQFIAFSDARIQHYTPRQFSDLDYAFRDAGVVSYYSFGPSWLHAFEPTIMYQLLPIEEYDFYFHKSWRVVFAEEREPVFTIFKELGMEKVQGDAYAWMKPRMGSLTWAYMQPLDLPWLVSWAPAGSNPGLAWVCGDEFNSQWWSLTPGTRGNNPYAIELTTNLILHSLGRDLISDIHARREARNAISFFQRDKLMVLSMMEWADAFGANTLPLSQRLRELENEVSGATELYLNQEYSDSIGIMEDLTDQITEIHGDAAELKDEALFWVYLSEWLVVTSVAILAGTVIWSLMIRRVAYREVAATRLRYD